MTDEHRYDTGNERRSADRRHSDRGATMTEAEPVTTERNAPGSESRMNPETVRTEPIESQRTSRQMDFWPEMALYRQRFDEIQARFIEEPREAVRKAEQLVEEAIDKMTNSMRERIRSMHRDAESGDTERLRLAMKSLRDFIESLGGRRAA